MTEKNGNIVGKNLRQLRDALGLNQDEVAEALGTASGTYSSWERGRTEPNNRWLRKLARYYDVSADRLLHSDSELNIGSGFPVGDPPKFHPIKYPRGFYALVYSLMFNHLLYSDAYERRIQVELIDSWKTDKREPSYTFYLRRDVKFHSGKLMEAEDVKYSYDEFLSSNSFYKGFLDAVEFKEKENAIKLRFKHNRWLELHSLPTPYIIPQTYEDRDQCMDGTGPFRMKRKDQAELGRDPEQPVILEGNDDYFETKPSIRTVKLQKFAPSKLKDGLVNGEINFAYALFWDERPDEFDVKHGSGNMAYYLVLNQDNEICDDANFRKAIDFGLNRKDIRENLIEKTDRKDIRFLPKRHLHKILLETPSQDDDSNHDENKAKEHLDLAEAAVGHLTFTIAPVNKEDEMTSNLVDEIVRQLIEMGVDAEQEDDIDKAHALVEVVIFDKHEAVSDNLDKTSGHPWRHKKNPFLESLLGNIEGIETYEKIQEILSAEKLFIPLVCLGTAVTYTKELDTKSSLRVTNPLYGPNVAHWEFK